MSATETATVSWGARIKKALIAIFIGIEVVGGSILLLFWNEGRAIKANQALAETAGLVISIDSGRVNPANNGKLVYISGPVKPLGNVSDPKFGITAAGALAIRRQVEMYQWVERSHTETVKHADGSETKTKTYSYSKQWSSSRVNSYRFKERGHDNPRFALDDSAVSVRNAKIGAFVLSADDLANLGSATKIDLTQRDINRVAAALPGNGRVHWDQGDIYVGRYLGVSEIGDIRISFSRVDLAEASFVGRQHGNTLEPYKASDGREIFLSAAGKKEPAALFGQAQTENTVITWLIRAGGLFGLLVGLRITMEFFVVLGDVIPFVGSLLGLNTAVLSVTLMLIVGPVVIAVGWFVYRPLLAVAIFGAGIVLAAGFAYLHRKPSTVISQPTDRAS